MKIKLTIPSGFLSREKSLVIDATKIQSMIENDDDGTDIRMETGEHYAVKETVAEIIAAYTPAPKPTTAPTPTPEPTE